MAKAWQIMAKHGKTHGKHMAKNMANTWHKHGKGLTNAWQSMAKHGKNMAKHGNTGLTHDKTWENMAKQHGKGMAKT